MSGESVKIDGLEVAMERLDIKSGDLVILRGNMSMSQIFAFKRQLFERLPLDHRIVCVVALADDQDITTLNLKDGDVVLIRGAISPSHLQAVRRNLHDRVPGLKGVEWLPDDVSMEVKRSEPGPGSIESGSHDHPKEEGNLT